MAKHRAARPSLALRLRRIALALLLLVGVSFVMPTASRASGVYCVGIAKSYYVYAGKVLTSTNKIGAATMRAVVCTDGGHMEYPREVSVESSTMTVMSWGGWSVWDTGAHVSYYYNGGFNYGVFYAYAHIRLQNCFAKWAKPCSYTSDDAIHLKVAMMNQLYVRPVQAGDFVLGGRVFRPYWWTTCNDNTGCGETLVRR